MSLRRLAACAAFLIALAACAQLIGLDNLSEGNGAAPPPDASEAGKEAGVEGGMPETCFDGIKNGDETFTDCGGSCHKCLPGQPCSTDLDCHDGCGVDDTGNKSCSGCSDGGKRIEGSEHCIDENEVSVVEYREFVDTVAGYETFYLPDECTTDVSSSVGWLDKFTPSVWGQDDPMLPVRYVSWCDAWAYCKWRGKRLCGSFARGSPNPFTSYADPRSNMWMRACAGPDGGPYPYPGGFQASNCNGAPAPSPVNVNSPPTTCTSISSRARNMSGNIAEWDDSCVGEIRFRTCHVRGGSFRSVEADGGLMCGADAGFTVVTDVRDDVGIRCCE